MSDTIEAPGTETARTFRGWIADMPRWKKLSLFAAGALVITGGVLMLTGGDAAPASGAGVDNGAGNPLAGNNLVPGGTGTTNPPLEQPVTEEPAARGVFRLGFSFIAGFCLGAFVRATLKIASIALGFWLAMTVALSYYGLVDVNWQGLDELWLRFTSNVESEWGSFQRFITGSLPAAGLVAGGFAIGLKRH